MRTLIGDSQPIVVALHAEEATGRNAIPVAYATDHADALGLPVDDEITQSNRPQRTGRDGAYRLATHSECDGAVEQGRRYLLVDDNVTQGGTLADLRTYIEQHAGNVVGATTLTGSRSSEILAPRADMLEQLRARFPDLEAKWKAALGNDFTGLSQGEATYLLRSKPSDGLGDRVIASAQEAAGGAVPGVLGKPQGG